MRNKTRVGDVMLAIDFAKTDSEVVAALQLARPAQQACLTKRLEQ